MPSSENIHSFRFRRTRRYTRGRHPSFPLPIQLSCWSCSLSCTFRLWETIKRRYSIIKWSVSAKVLILTFQAHRQNLKQPKRQKKMSCQFRKMAQQHRFASHWPHLMSSTLFYKMDSIFMVPHFSQLKRIYHSILLRKLLRNVDGKIRIQYRRLSDIHRLILVFIVCSTETHLEEFESYFPCLMQQDFAKYHHQSEKHSNLACKMSYG